MIAESLIIAQLLIVDRACLAWGGKDYRMGCSEMAKKCGKPQDIAKWAVADCNAAAFVACWPKRLHGEELEVCIDNYLETHPVGETPDRSPEALRKFHDWCLRMGGTDAECGVQE